MIFMGVQMLRMFYGLAHVEKPSYAITWLSNELNHTAGLDNATGPLGVEECTCGCSYPVSDKTLVNLFVIACATAVRAFSIAFRCLKGIRHSNWAGLVSVVFPV